MREGFQKRKTAKRRTKVPDLHTFPDTTWRPPSGTISLFHSWPLAPWQLTSLGKGSWPEKQMSVGDSIVALHYFLKEGRICPAARGIGWGRFPGTREGLRLGGKRFTEGCRAVGVKRARIVRGTTWAESRADVPLCVNQRERGLAC